MCEYAFFYRANPIEKDSRESHQLCENSPAISNNADLSTTAVYTDYQSAVLNDPVLTEHQVHQVKLRNDMAVMISYRVPCEIVRPENCLCEEKS